MNAVTEKHRTVLGLSDSEFGIAKMRFPKFLRRKIRVLWKIRKNSVNTHEREINTDEKCAGMEVLEELEVVFRHFDANGDGKISASELGAVINSLFKYASSEEELELIMKEIDSDGDGLIDLQEFIHFNTKGEGGFGTLNELRDAFRIFDSDNDGYISAEELRSVMASMGDRRSLEDCLRMIRVADSDGDGFVDFEEFKKMMTKEEKTEDCHPKGKNNTKLIVVLLTGNHVQTRLSKLERNSQKKEKDISNRHKKQEDN